VTILVVAGSAIRRLWRSRLLMVTGIIALLIIGLTSSSIVFISVAQEAGESQQAQQAAIGVLFFIAMLMGWFASLVALLIGVTVTWQELRDGTIFGLLAKPIARWEYLAGKYLGSLGYLLLIWAILGGIYGGLVSLTGQSWSMSHSLTLVGRLTLSVLVLSLAFGLAQGLSMGVAAVLTLVIYNGKFLVKEFAQLLSLVKVTLPDAVTRTMIYPFPATDGLDALFQSVLEVPLDALPVGWVFLHLVDYSIAALLVGWWLFRRRDLAMTD